MRGPPRAPQPQVAAQRGESRHAQQGVEDAAQRTVIGSWAGTATTVIATATATDTTAAKRHGRPRRGEGTRITSSPRSSKMSPASPDATGRSRAASQIDGNDATNAAVPTAAATIVNVTQVPD